MKKALLPLFVLFSVLTIIGEAIGSWQLIFATKPFLMVFLSLWFYFKTEKNSSSFRFWILLGLIFSIGGDTFLMFVENPPHWESFFLLGLGSFLITHVSYILAFAKYPDLRKGWVYRLPALAIPFLIFLFGNTYVLWDGVPTEMKVPVVVYSSAIMLMAVACMNMRFRVPAEGFKLLFAGVLFFVVSDTFIGLNKFAVPEKIPYVRLIIMAFYLLGQYFIAKGAVFVLNNENKTTE